MPGIGIVALHESGGGSRERSEKERRRAAITGRSEKGSGSRGYRRVVLQGVGKQGRSTSGSTPVVHHDNALVSMQTGRTPPYLTHNRILTWEVADETPLSLPLRCPPPANSRATCSLLAPFLLESHLPHNPFPTRLFPRCTYIYVCVCVYIDRVEGGKNIWEIVIPIEPIKRVPAARRTILRVDRRLPQIYSTDKFV